METIGASQRGALQHRLHKSLRQGGIECAGQERHDLTQRRTRIAQEVVAQRHRTQCKSLFDRAEAKDWDIDELFYSSPCRVPDGDYLHWIERRQERGQPVAVK